MRQEPPPFKPNEALIGYIEEGQRPVERATVFTVVFRPVKADGGCCGNQENFPNEPIGSVIRCGYCGRLWKRRSNWASDGQARWSLEGWRERRQRTKRKGLLTTMSLVRSLWRRDFSEWLFTDDVVSLRNVVRGIAFVLVLGVPFGIDLAAVLLAIR